MKTLPRLWRRKRDGAEFGAWHIYIRNKPVNLSTDDRPLAVERRKEAVRGVRKWPRKFAPKAAPEMSRNSDEGAVARTLAALGEVAPDSQPEHSQQGLNPVPEAPGAGADSSSPAPEMGAPPLVDAEPIPTNGATGGAGWADDLGQAAAAPPEQAPAQPIGLRLQDLPMFDGLLVTGSKIAVGGQLWLQAFMMRLVADVEAGRVGAPPKVSEPSDPESVAEFMKVASARWQADDPREPGRAAYERTILALLPPELPIPAWLKWFEAPVVTAINTVPVQWQGAKKIKRDAEGKPVEETPAAAEAQPVAQAA